VKRKAWRREPFKNNCLLFSVSKSHPEPAEGLTDGRSYLQRFPISETHLIDLPTFALLDKSGAKPYQFVYRDDFVELAGEGAVEGELVWL